MLVELYAAQIGHPHFGTLDMDRPPQLDEYVRFEAEAGDDAPTLPDPWRVLYVHTVITQLGGRLTPRMMIYLTQEEAHAYTLYIEWANPEERPMWFSDDFTLRTDIMPRVGELIEIVAMQPLETEPGATMIALADLEVVGIAHSALVQPGDGYHEAHTEGVLQSVGCVTTGVIVRFATKDTTVANKTQMVVRLNSN